MRTLIPVVLSLILLISCHKANSSKDKLELSDKLEGTWEASAFSGKLHEKWELGTDGWMQQQGYYIEENDTSYSAKTKIEKIGETIILFSVIKNSTPKIFKSINHNDTTIIFENKDYKNPFRVTYKFLDKGHYKRTIEGYENDSLVKYEFHFNRVD